MCIRDSFGIGLHLGGERIEDLPGEAGDSGSCQLLAESDPSIDTAGQVEDVVSIDRHGPVEASLDRTGDLGRLAGVGENMCGRCKAPEGRHQNLRVVDTALAINHDPICLLYTSDAADDLL